MYLHWVSLEPRRYHYEKVITGWGIDWIIIIHYLHSTAAVNWTTNSDERSAPIIYYIYIYLTIAISSSSNIRGGIPSHLTIYHGLERNIILIVVHFVIRLIQKYNRRRLLRWMERMTLLYIQLEGLLRLPFKHNFTTTTTSTQDSE